MIRRGFLSDHFEQVAFKRLSAVEASPERSNQHEFNGVAGLRSMFGDLRREELPAIFVWLGAEQSGITSDGWITWYDARKRHPTRTEYRLYYPSNPVTALMEEGSAFFLALRRDGSALVVVTPSGSSFESQLVWLFGLEAQPEFSFSTRSLERDADPGLDFAARYLLDELGVELEEPDTTELDNFLAPFGTAFPTTREFSKAAQKSLPEISASEDDPDDVLVAWLEREELLFRRLERLILAERLEKGFVDEGEPDVDGFLKFSLSVQNRRKSRAGYALENHLEAIFKARKIDYVRGEVTERRNRPDFMFPSAEDYRDPGFPESRLTMLGAKSSLKDRWRQVLPEARRIKNKHLLTLEPAISESQTDQMKAENLQLVVPRQFHATFTAAQQSWLFTLNSFIELVDARQSGST